nr:ribonuclease H-like domain-containing protein [Tanacetum cinerariifolium]
MDYPTITMEEYIRLEEEQARRRGKMYNWETATYGKIWFDEDVHNLRSVETKFPAILFNDAFTSEVTLSYESTVSPLNDNKADFRIPFYESDDEDYTVIYDKKSFSYNTIIDIYAAGSESGPPMLNKENYEPWSSRLLRYAKSRPNRKLIHNSILNGPYVRRMIPE